MSVTTTSDEKRMAASEKLAQAAEATKEAHKLLSEAIDPNTWGANQYNNDFSKMLEEAEIEILLISRALTKLKNKI